MNRAGSAVMQFEENKFNLVACSLNELLAGPALDTIQNILPAYLVRQRWFGAKSRTIASIRVLDWVELPRTSNLEPRTSDAAIVFLQIAYAAGEPDIYQLPLAVTAGPQADAVHTNAPASILASVTAPDGPAILHDATAREDVRQSLLSLIETNATLIATIPAGPRAAEVSARKNEAVILSEGGASAAEVPSASGPSLAGHASASLAAARGTGPLPSRAGSAEQSNTSIIYGNRMILKLFRRLQPGENPDAEIGRFLTEVAHFPRIPPFLGQIVGHPRGSRDPNPPPSDQTTLAMLQGLIQNEGDGWQHTLDSLARYYEAVATVPPPANTGSPPAFLDEPSAEPIPDEAHQHAAPDLEAAALLGRRTAELHLALATSTSNPAFRPEPFTTEALAADAARIHAQVVRALDALQHSLSALSDKPSTTAAPLILSRRADLLARARAVADVPPEQAGLRTRIHGDYHLGQVLRARADYVILDFEGEPARPLAERRAKQSPLKDVAGMLRSFSYAAHTGLDRFASSARPSQSQPNAAAQALQPWAQLWQNAVATQFLNAWRTTIAANPQLTPQPTQGDRLLNAYLLEKALYELLYELNNRPTWVGIPLAGILALAPGS